MMTGRSFGLDCMRALAALTVVVAHALFIIAAYHPGAITTGVVLATFGVEAFFVLSGFLIGGNLLEVAAGKRSAFDFWARRCRRTLPNYYFFLAINFLLFLLIAPERVPSGAYLAFGQSLASPAHSAFFAESWSLAVEEWFYLCASVAALLCARFGGRSGYGARVMLGLLVLTVIATPIARSLWVLAHGYTWDDGLRKLTLFRFDGLALGVLTAAIRLHWREVSARYVWLSATAGVALLACITPHIADIVARQQLLAPVTQASTAIQGSAVLLAIGLAFALLLPAISAGQASSFERLNTAIRQLANWSYSIYLVHVPLVLILRFVRPQVGSLNSPVDVIALLVWFVATIGLAMLAYRYIERRYYVANTESETATSARQPAGK